MTNLRTTSLTLAQTLAAMSCALLAVIPLLWLMGRPGWTVVATLWEGPFGDRYRFCDALGRSCPLILCGLSVAVAFRCRAWNIGAEGQYVCGAILATAVGVHCGPPQAGPAWITLGVLIVAAALGGVVWALVCALLEVYRRVPLVLGTILMNFVATGLLSYMVYGPLQGADRSIPESESISPSARLLTLVDGTDFHLGWYAAVLAAGVVWFLVHHTSAGFALRAVGGNPVAARFAGINVGRVTIAAMALSGALAGLAGGMQVAGVSYLLHVQAAEGFGYMGIAVALLARLHPLGVVLAGVALAMLDVGAMHVERTTMLGVPADLATAVKGVLILAVLVFSSAAVSRRLNRLAAGERA